MVFVSSETLHLTLTSSSVGHEIWLLSIPSREIRYTPLVVIIPTTISRISLFQSKTLSRKNIYYCPAHIWITPFVKNIAPYSKYENLNFNYTCRKKYYNIFKLWESAYLNITSDISFLKFLKVSGPPKITLMNFFIKVIQVFINSTPGSQSNISEEKKIGNFKVHQVLNNTWKTTHIGNYSLYTSGRP